MASDQNLVRLRGEISTETAKRERSIEFYLGFLYELKSKEIKNNKYAWHIYVLYVKIILHLEWLVLAQ